MTENALSILIVIFSVQLQQTKISDRKLFIFQLGFHVLMEEYYRLNVRFVSPASLLDGSERK